MGYEYTNPARASEAYALPNVEIFHAKAGEWWYDRNGERCDEPAHQGTPCIADSPDGELCSDHAGYSPCGEGFYFAFGFPGCMWDSEPSGPYDTYEAALEAAREMSGDED